MDQVKLTREELIEYAKVFHETAYKANSYLSVLSQFGEYVTEYNDQINVSPTFYGIVYHALIESSPELCVNSLSYNQATDFLEAGLSACNC